MFFIIGILLLGCFVLFTFSALKLAKKADEEMEKEIHSKWNDWIFTDEKIFVFSVLCYTSYEVKGEKWQQSIL